MGFSPKTMGRSWMVTVHIANMEKAGLSEAEYEKPEKLAAFFINLWEKSGTKRSAAAAVCVSKEGLLHMHMALYGNTTTLKKVSDTLFQSHVEPQLGGKKALLAYLKKDPPYEEKGETVLFTQGLENIKDRQGSGGRHDLDEIEDMLNAGATPEEIFEASFRFRRYEKMVKGAYLSKRIKETPIVKEMHNEFHFGKPGTGKTYEYKKLCDRYSPDDVYLCNDYANAGSSGGGFDFYVNNPAKVLMLDEFRGQIPYANLLSLLDVYSGNQQHARYQNTYNLWTSVYICSIYPLEKIYEMMVAESERHFDSYQQLLRRLHKVVYHYRDADGHFERYELPIELYTGADNMIAMAKVHEKTAREMDELAKTDDTKTVEEMLQEFGAKQVKSI